MEKAANKLLKSFFFKSRHGVMEHDLDKNMYCTSPQPSNSCRFVCNNLRAHKCWYSVCVPMTLKQAVHGQGGMTDHLQSMVQEARRVVADVTALLGNRAEACAKP